MPIRMRCAALDACLQACAVLSGRVFVEQPCEVVGIDGLDEVIVESGLRRPLAIARVAVFRQREQQHRMTVGLVTDAPRDLVPVETRKTDVDDGHFRTHLLKELEPAVAGFCFEHPVASVLEHDAEHLACIATVLD